MTKRLFSVLIDADVANACEPLVMNRKFSETVTTLLRSHLLGETDKPLLASEQVTRSQNDYQRLMKDPKFSYKLKLYPQQKDYWVRACGFKSIADLDKWYEAIMICSTK